MRAWISLSNRRRSRLSHGTGECHGKAGRDELVLIEILRRKLHTVTRKEHQRLVFAFHFVCERQTTAFAFL